MLKSHEISVIIPSNHDQNELFNLISALCNQTFKPFEIIVIDSSVLGVFRSLEICLICKKYGIKFNFEHRDYALPGDARNIGLSIASGEFIAFIDVQTIPRPYWLESCLNTLHLESADGVFGATYFRANNRFERIVRDGFYGNLPRRTLPGSVFKREVFHKAGQFIDWVRAGEDTEWMLRLEVLKIPIVFIQNPLIDYGGLVGLDIHQLLEKWHRNYTASRELPHFVPQKLLLWLVIYPFLFLIAYNWNYLVANWNVDSPFYIGHVTKIAAILPFLSYFLLRGLILPLKRGVDIFQLLPLRFLLIISVCFLADLVKIFVFSIPKRKP